MTSNPTKEAARTYLKSMALIYLGFMIVLIGSRIAADHLSGPSRLIDAALPALPVIAFAVAMVRFVQNTDEFKRRSATESLAIAGGVTAVLATCYGLLEGDYLPRPSAWWVWFILMGSWAVAAWIQRWRYR